VKPWFRFHTGVVDDPKVQMLSPEMFKHWVNVLCIAAQHDGELPAITVTAFTLRMTEAKAAGILAKLQALDLLDATEKSFKPHNWDGRQYKTDLADNTNAERQKNHRKRKRDELNELKALRDRVRNMQLRNGVSHVTAKRPDTETERISSTEDEDTGLAEGRPLLSAEALARATPGRRQ
jgi:hypothetical protein